MSDGVALRVYAFLGLVYAYTNGMVAYKAWLDADDDTKLLREIRDLLKQTVSDQGASRSDMAARSRQGARLG